MSSKVKIVINKDILNYKKGDQIYVKCDENGIPTEKFWRERLKDAENDNFVSLYCDKSKNNKSKKEKSTD